MFTDEAKKEASKHNVKLIEGGLMVEMLNYYCPDVQKEPVGNDPENSQETSVADV